MTTPRRRVAASFRSRAVGVTLLAAGFRFWRLPDLPPGLQFDEAHNALDAARWLDGARPLFLPDNGGREILRTWLDAPVLAALGRPHAALALAFVSAAVGTVTVALVAVAVARLLGSDSGSGPGTAAGRRGARAVGLLAAAYLAVGPWHVHFSRYGIRAVLAPLWTTAAVLAWWSATRPGPARRADGRAAACGALLAAAVYSHPTGRLLPLLPAGHAAAAWIAGRRGDAAARAAARRAVRALGLAGGVALLLFAPLGAFFARHPWLFTSHASDVSLAAVAARDHGGRLAAALGAHALAVLGMFAVRGDPSTFHNLPGLPVFDPLTALAATLGAGALIGLALGRGPRREAAWLLLGWLGLMLVPTLVSDRPPNYSRAIAALPVVVTLPALGLAWGHRALGAPRAAPWLAAAAVGWAAAWGGARYFRDFAGLDALYVSYDLEKLDAVAFLEGAARDASVFLAPLWATHATVDYVVGAARGTGPPALRALDARDTLVWPAEGRDVVVAFPARESAREGQAASAASLLGAAAPPVERARDARGEPLLEWLRVPRAALGDLAPPTDAPLEPTIWSGARFGGALELVGLSLGAARPGAQLPVTLVWRALEPVARDLTVFVHLSGPGGESWGQDDREPGHASYRTSRWAEGDVVVDRYAPVLDPAARGAVTVCVGWYDRASGARLPMGDAGDAFCPRALPIAAGDG